MSKKLIDDAILLQMINQGKPQKDIAQHFHVSPVAVCKRLKRLLPEPEFVLVTHQQKQFVIAKAQGRSYYLYIDYPRENF